MTNSLRLMCRFLIISAVFQIGTTYYSHQYQLCCQGSYYAPWRGHHNHYYPSHGYLNTYRWPESTYPISHYFFKPPLDYYPYDPCRNYRQKCHVTLFYKCCYDCCNKLRCSVIYNTGYSTTIRVPDTTKELTTILNTTPEDTTIDQTTITTTLMTTVSETETPLTTNTPLTTDDNAAGPGMGPFSTTETPITTETPLTTEIPVTTENPLTTKTPLTTEVPIILTTTESPSTTVIISTGSGDGAGGGSGGGSGKGSGNGPDDDEGESGSGFSTTTEADEPGIQRRNLITEDPDDDDDDFIFIE